MSTAEQVWVKVFLGGLLPCNIAAVRDVSLLPGVAVATCDN